MKLVEHLSENEQMSDPSQMTLPSSGSDAPMVDAPRLDDGDAHAVPYAAPVFDCLPLVPPAHCFVHRPAQDLQVRTFTTANALEDTNSKPVAAIVVVKEGSEELTVHADGTPLTVGCHSSKSLSHHRVYKRHLQFAFVDGALTLKALQPGIHLLRLGTSDHDLLPHESRVPLGDGDIVSLFYDGERPRIPLTVRLSAHSPTATPQLNSNEALLLRVHAAEQRARMLQFDNDRLRSDLDTALVTEQRCLDVIHAALARRDDALERRRVRDEGIFCGCCAQLRLPDHFFPAMLASGVPPARRRCAFCVEVVRAQHDHFGRPFFVPSGFAMPTPHSDDLTCLAQLRRCASCASMRHPSMLTVAREGTMLACFHPAVPCTISAPIPRDAPRRPATCVPLCVFCRRSQRHEQHTGSVPSTSAPSTSPCPAPDADRTWRWQPDPDDPGCSSGSDVDDGDYDDGDFGFGY